MDRALFYSGEGWQGERDSATFFILAIYLWVVAS